MINDTNLIDAQDSDEAQSRLSKIEGIGERLQRLADDRVARRAAIEERWIQDTRQFNGEYDPEITFEASKSKAFYNGTRKLCFVAEARWAEMCLPTDDRNWAIQPTPIAKLFRSVFSDDPSQRAMSAAFAAAIDKQGPAMQAEAKKRALKMQGIIDDQLSECSYNAIMRRVIADAVRLGTGIVKAPVVVSRQASYYQRKESFPGVVENVRVTEQFYAPIVERVSPWDFFPDDSAARIEDAENTLERHRLNRRQVTKLKEQPEFDPAALDRVLSRKPGWRSDGRIEDAYSKDVQDSEKNKYQVWEFHGYLPADEYNAYCCPDEAVTSEKPVTIWFCDGEVLKVADSLVAADQQLYSAICWDEDEHSIFGSGLPRRIRTSQMEANSLLRLRMDHSALAAIPQFVVNKQALIPANGRHEIRAGKMWYTQGGQPANAGLFAVEVPCRIGDLQAQFEKAVQRMEDESGLPLMAQSGQEPQVTQTATGTAMLMNSATSPLRKLVRSFDDNITRPVLRAMYAWNMEFHDDDEAKGDYDIIAMGSVALLVREQQTQGLIQLAQLAAQFPQFTGMVKFPELWRQIVASQGLNADGVTKTEDEIAQEQEQAAQQPQQPDADALKLQIEQGKLEVLQQRVAVDQLKAQVAAQDSQNDLQRAQIAASTALSGQQLQASLAQAKMGNDIQLKQFDATARMGEIKIKEDAANQRFNAELAVKTQYGSGF